MPQFGGASEKCHVCAKTVYLAEKIVVEDKEEKKTFHKSCLKCTHCKATLSLGNYASMNGVMYCKPHFKQLFATKGNYDEGFGKEKLTSKWAPNAPPAASSAGSFVPVEKTDEASKTPEKAATPSSIASKFQKTSFNSERCEKCNKTVYVTEKIVVEEKEGKKVFHKACLRCSHCQVVLSLGNYASMGGIMYCKPHFKQLFATKGNYDEGFGKEKHTTKWEAQSNAAPATFVPVEKTDTPKDNRSAPSEIANKFKGISVSGSDKCNACGKTVYLTERTVVEDKEDKKVFHKACLRCTHCQVVLSLGNYASMGGVMYCKPHFKQLFASKGNYDEGFGKQKHTAKWIEQDEKAEEATSRDRTVDEPHTHSHEEHDHSHHAHDHSHHDHDHDHDHSHDHDHTHTHETTTTVSQDEPVAETRYGEEVPRDDNADKSRNDEEVPHNDGEVTYNSDHEEARNVDDEPRDTDSDAHVVHDDNE